MPAPADIGDGVAAAATLIPGVGTYREVRADLSRIEDVATAARRWVSDRHNWVRVGWFAAGSIMITTGVIMLGIGPARAAASTARNVKKAVT